MPAVYNGQEVVFGLDIGTRSIVGTVGYKNAQNRFEIVAQVEKFHDTRAMLDGQIHDISKVAETIAYVKNQLEKKMNIQLKDVCIAAAGRVLKTAVGVVDEDLEDNAVVDDELVYTLEMLGVEKANDIISEENQTDDKFYCVGYTVVRYFLNGFAIGNLVGHKARKIGAEVLATFLPEDVVDGLYAAVSEAGLEVVNLTLEPIAAMNVAIPEQYRLLNIALVDVGAGTSDICITKDGSVVAYGMIPFAGDKLTEVLVQKYLVDFQTAEKIKMMPANKKTMNYKDIMGDKQKITRDEINADLKESIDFMTQEIADKITELNGGKPVSAVFVVGGGGKVENFTGALADKLGLVKNRVAIRGPEVMGSIDMLDETLKKDALYVTPIGICINYYEKKNNFIFVTVNDERVKLYNNNKLSVMDAAAAAAFPNEKLFPRRGADITFTINGKQRIVRGNRGEAAVIKLNKKEVSMTSPVTQNDKIVITESTVGDPAYLEVRQLPEYSDEIHFRVNGQTITCPKYALVNDELKSEYYSIQDGDQVNILDYYTVEQLLMFLDLSQNVSFFINHERASLKDRIYENYMINWAENVEKLEDLEKSVGATNVEDESVEMLAEKAEISVSDTSQASDAKFKNSDDNGKKKKKEKNKLNINVSKEDLEKQVAESDDVNEMDAETQEAIQQEAIKNENKEPIDLHIIVNNQPITLKNKPSYIFVDILDFYPFDVSNMGGTRLVTTLNDLEVGFTEDLHEGDVIKIYWEN